MAKAIKPKPRPKPRPTRTRKPPPAADPPSAHLPNLPRYEYPPPPPGGFPVLPAGVIPPFTPPPYTAPPGEFDGSTWDGVSPRRADYRDKPTAGTRVTDSTPPGAPP